MEALALTSIAIAYVLLIAGAAGLAIGIGAIAHGLRTGMITKETFTKPSYVTELVRATDHIVDRTQQGRNRTRSPLDKSAATAPLSPQRSRAEPTS